MPKDLNTLNLFPTYATREAFVFATGEPFPAYDPEKPAKYWYDPNAEFSNEDIIVYDRVFVKLLNDKPVWKRLFLTPAQAATVNIPPAGVPGDPSSPTGQGKFVPVPMRELEDDETIISTMGIPMVYTAAELEKREVGFSQADRERLKRIAVKLEVE